MFTEKENLHKILHTEVVLTINKHFTQNKTLHNLFLN